MQIKEVEITKWTSLASKLNEIIRALNALLAMTVSPASAGNLKVTKANAVLTINGPGGGQWREYTDCDGNTFEVWTRNFTAVDEE